MSYSLPQINLAFQIVIFALLFVSLYFKQRGKFLLHGSTVLIAVILNIVSFIWVMGPSLLNMQEFISNMPTNKIAITAIGHGIFGTTAIILGVWLVVSWGLRSSAKTCTGKKKLMRVTLVLWFLSLVLGILLYAFLYVI